MMWFHRQRAPTVCRLVSVLTRSSHGRLLKVGLAVGIVQESGFAGRGGSGWALSAQSHLQKADPTDFPRNQLGTL